MNSISDPWVYDLVPNALQRGLGTFVVGQKDADSHGRSACATTASARRPSGSRTSLRSRCSTSSPPRRRSTRSSSGIDNTSAPRLHAVMNAVKTESRWETRPSPGPNAVDDRLEGDHRPGLQRDAPLERLLGLRRAGRGRPEARARCGCSTSRRRSTRASSSTRCCCGATPQAGAIQGVSEALHEQVTFNKSTITDRDWVSYPILRIVDAPTVKVILINNPSVGAYGGAGEGPNGFVMAAIAGAVHDATGKKPRKIPFVPKYIKTLLAS